VTRVRLDLSQLVESRSRISVLRPVHRV
jgi:hypothetical protein